MSETLSAPVSDTAPTAAPSLLGAIEPDAMAAICDRREAITRGIKASSFVTAALSMGSIPIALGALATEVKAQAATTVVVDVLQYALLLENLEAEFYKAVLNSSSVPAFNAAFATVRALVPAAALPALTLIRDHEIKHVAFLRRVISSLGATPTTYDPAATFDFTGGRGSGTGPFAAATTDLGFLLAATQGFEDTGVRAYKGQAGKLLRTPSALTPALQIHSLEARHAAKIRRLRRGTANSATDATAVRFSGTVKGGGQAAAGSTASGLPAEVVSAFAAIYANEQNTSHTVNNGTADATIDAAGLAGLNPGTDVTLAFDEALSAVQVGAIVQPFIIPPVTLPASLQNG